MKNCIAGVEKFCLQLVVILLAVISGNAMDPIQYTLTGPSTFANDCLPCGRPLILQPLRGTFSLLADSPTSTFFQVTNIHWTAYQGTNIAYRVQGGGTFAMDQKGTPSLQQMRLVLMVDNGITNETVILTNNPSSATNPWPVVDINLTEQTKSLFRVYELHLLAYPIVDLWYSTAKPFGTTNSAGDVLSYNSAQTVLNAKNVTQNFGPLPAGNRIDALTLSTNGEVYFSLTQDFTNVAGSVVHNGDLLSNRGDTIASNGQLIRSFGRQIVPTDVGLDAAFLTSEGKILFSISESQYSQTLHVTLNAGDILSADGSVVRTGAKLLENFQPISSTTDPGLDAFYIWPNGEIWFSTEQDFDTQLGKISAGDLLSDRGYIVFKNADLILPFSSVDQTQDYGLTAFYIVSDFAANPKPPQFTSATSKPGLMSLEWIGPGKVFRLESAGVVSGPYLEDGSWLIGTNALRMVVDPSRFYRLRQW